MLRVLAVASAVALWVVTFVTGSVAWGAAALLWTVPVAFVLSTGLHVHVTRYHYVDGEWQERRRERLRPQPGLGRPDDPNAAAPWDRL